MLMKMITKCIYVSNISFGIQNLSLFDAPTFLHSNRLISAPVCFTPSVEIGDCALWRQKWLSMLALMLTICCTSQIVWHQSSMQKHVVCFKCYGNFSLPIIRVFFVHWFSTLTVIEYNSLNLVSQSLEVIVLWMFKIISHGPMSINFFGLLALELEDVSVYYSFSAHGRQ